MRSKVQVKAEVRMGDAVVVTEIMVDGGSEGMRMIHLSLMKSFNNCHHCSVGGFMRVVMQGSVRIPSNGLPTVKQGPCRQLGLDAVAMMIGPKMRMEMSQHQLVPPIRWDVVSCREIKGGELMAMGEMERVPNPTLG